MDHFNDPLVVLFEVRKLHSSLVFIFFYVITMILFKTPKEQR